MEQALVLDLRVTNSSSVDVAGRLLMRILVPAPANVRGSDCIKAAASATKCRVIRVSRNTGTPRSQRARTTALPQNPTRSPFDVADLDRCIHSAHPRPPYRDRSYDLALQFNPRLASLQLPRPSGLCSGLRGTAHPAPARSRRARESSSCFAHCLPYF